MTLIKLIGRSQPALSADLLLSWGQRKISNINWKYFKNVTGNWEERRTVSFNIIYHNISTSTIYNISWTYIHHNNITITTAEEMDKTVLRTLDMIMSREDGSKRATLNKIFLFCQA